MSLAGPAPDGFYQACFFDPPDLDSIRIETIARALRAGYVVTGDITVAPHRLSYLGAPTAELIVVTVPVELADREAVPA